MGRNEVVTEVAGQSDHRRSLAHAMVEAWHFGGDDHRVCGASRSRPRTATTLCYLPGATAGDGASDPSGSPPGQLHARQLARRRRRSPRALVERLARVLDGPVVRTDAAGLKVLDRKDREEQVKVKKAVARNSGN